MGPPPGICCWSPECSVAVYSVWPAASVISTQHVPTAGKVSRNGLRTETVAPAVVRATTGATGAVEVVVDGPAVVVVDAMDRGFWARPWTAFDAVARAGV